MKISDKILAKQKKDEWLDKNKSRDSSESHESRIQTELQNCGLSRYALHSMEGNYLHKIIRLDEHIEGAVFGREANGLVMLIATNWRVIYLDCKPMFVKEDEINYRFVSGVVYSRAPIGTIVTLHTRVKDFKLFTFNISSAQKFVGYIESRCMKNENIPGAL